MFAFAGSAANPAPEDPAFAHGLVPPWGNSQFGTGGRMGGRYFNLRIPFQTRVRVAAYTNGTDPLGMFAIIHGADGAPTAFGGVTLPSSARLRVSERRAVRVHEYAQMSALDTAGAAGAVALWIFSVSNSSMGYSFIEGCQRGWLDGQLTQLGSGEDFFDGSYGFDAGVFALPHAGLVAQGKEAIMVYRVADDDVIFWRERANLTRGGPVSRTPIGRASAWASAATRAAGRPSTARAA